MTIIDFMKEKLSGYPGIAEFAQELHLDFTDAEPTNYGLSSTGDALIKEDLLGNQTRQHSFVLYAVNQSFTDYNRLANSNFLLELCYWLEHLPAQEGLIARIDEKELPGMFIKATSANAMLFSVPAGDVNNGVMYQIQIYAQYKIESEEL